MRLRARSDRIEFPAPRTDISLLQVSRDRGRIQVINTREGACEGHHSKQNLKAVPQPNTAIDSTARATVEQNAKTKGTMSTLTFR